MADFCTCGAQLPPDARFCHKCGKPQYADALTEAAPAPSLEIPSGIPSHKDAPLPVNFHNRLAVRIGLSVASIAAPLSWALLLGAVVWMFIAGFLSVFFYRRRTAQFLTVRSGARLGWMTGVLSFVILTVLFTITIVGVNVTHAGGIAAVYRDQLRNMPIQDQNMQQALELFQTPAGIALVLLFFLLVLFVFITSASTVGGAVGAKIVGKD